LQVDAIEFRIAEIRVNRWIQEQSHGQVSSGDEGRETSGSKPEITPSLGSIVLGSIASPIPA
jgi:hypothetical protein